ncbi:hypothetical protein [Nannocystis punicea]|uniref:Tetratricopeptide repeat protein n=1 Tax=Nannocystis punicea TaxID=2995304 RepID=A0ABY7GWS1_9BACT|nr:hypothetical protein [Nannocystis poenicansa]WAS91436.1 hypothetical protein O0S08_35070 [Nannocystis poenicansa]
MYEHEVLEPPAYQRVSAVYDKARAEAKEPDGLKAREAAYREALRWARKTGDGALVAAAWYYLAKFWEGEYEREKACTAHLRLIAAEHAKFGPLHAELAGSWHNFGTFLVEAHEPALVECGMRISLALGRLQGAGEDFAAVQQTILVLWNAELYERMFRWAPHLEGWTEQKGLGHAYRCLGHAYGRVGRHDEAQAAYEACLRLLQEGDEHYDDAWLGYAESFVERAAPKVDMPAGMLAELRALVDGAEEESSDRQRAMKTLLACGTAEDLPRILAVAAEAPLTVRSTCCTLMGRGFDSEEIHRALREVAARSSVVPIASGTIDAVEWDANTSRRHEALARFELDQGMDARAALRAACQGPITTDLVGRLALHLLDDGDAAGLDALSEQHAAVRGAMLRVVRAVLELERDPTEASMLAVYRAFAAWAKPWAARLDEDGKPPAKRAHRSDD